MTSQDFLFEIGTEELPPKPLRRYAKSLCDNLCQQLDEAEIAYEKSQYFATPRRLAVLIRHLTASQPTKIIERQGPSYSAAYNQDGTPTLACIGFARSCGVTTDQLLIKDTNKGKRLYCRIEASGKGTEKQLSSMILQALHKIPFGKSMRWGNCEKPFVRPVHWLVALFGNEVIDLEMFGHQAGRKTYGHRFHQPDAIELSHPCDYEKQLETKGKVVVDFDKRKNRIRQQIEKKSAILAGEPSIDEKLLDEVTALVEWPVVLAGQFKTEFLEVPAEALMTSMKTHQKCFPVHSAEGRLQPCFILVSNIESKQPESVIAGNERVINARLSDAAFFYNNDLGHPLKHFGDQLKKVVFQQTLGTLHDRTQRLIKLNTQIAKQLGLNVQQAARAAELCKFDLVSEMVGEFPELQGTMGYYYASHAQEQPNVTAAIKQHYYPRFSGDALPPSKFSAALALADRLDLLVGILGINKHPSGEKDPYALRRTALGLMRLLIEKALPLDLHELLVQTLKNFAIELPNHNVVEQAYQFCMDRLRAWYLEQEVSREMFAAVEASTTTQPLDFDRRLKAVQKFIELPESKALTAANKRVSNLLKKAGEKHANLNVSPTLFEFEIEKQLSQLIQEKTQRVKSLFEKADYTQALTALACLKEPVDGFFDQVMVMVDNEKIRNNRLALLSNLHGLFTQVADISLLA